MSSMLVHVLPLAAAAAVSPALLGASLEVLIAFGSRSRRMLLLYLLGAALVVAGAIALSIVLPQRPPAGRSGAVGDIVDFVLGGLLVVVAVVLIFRRGGSGQSGTMKRLLSSRLAGPAILLLGIFMMLTNVSTLVLAVAGAHEVRSAAAGAVADVIGEGLLVLGALLPILLPLIWAAASPAGAARELGRVNAVISRHGRTIGIVVCALTAAYLVARGLGVV